MAFPRSPSVSYKRPKILGTTFSQLQCSYMGLDYQDAFRKICSLGFNRIRLCSYWNEIESIENQFNFSTLDWLLEESHKHNLEVVLAVGMKVPRWPEFHFPEWLKARHDTGGSSLPIDRNQAIANHALNFVQAVVNHTRKAPAIKYWQVENEPFTRLDITAGRFLSYEFVRREVQLVRTLASLDQKIAITSAIALPAAQASEDEEAFRASIFLADAVGFNVYTKVPIGRSSFYLEPQEPFWQKLQEWQKSLVDNGKEKWVAEAQAEPWEPNHLVAMDKAEYPSSTPKRVTHLVTTLTDIGFDAVMLWGCEYWCWQRKKGRNLWWWTIQQLIEA